VFFLGLFFLVLHALDWLVALPVCVLVIPRLFVRSETRIARWGARLGGFVLWAVVFHARQIVGPLLALSIQAQPDLIAHGRDYCSGVDVVSPAPLGDRFIDDVDEVGRRFDPQPGYSLEGSSGCGPSCAAWIEAGRVRRMFVTTNTRMWLNAYATGLPTMTSIEPRYDDLECTRSGFESFARSSAYAFGPGSQGASAVRPAWSDHCFAQSTQSPSSPVLAATLSIAYHDIGLDLLRVDYTSRVEEISSHKVLATSRMTQLRHVSGTIEPMDLNQQITVGRLTAPADLLTRYFDANCGGFNGRLPPRN
jgi:hypothetical protein